MSRDWQGSKIEKKIESKRGRQGKWKGVGRKLERKENLPGLKARDKSRKRNKRTKKGRLKRSRKMNS